MNKKVLVLGAGGFIGNQLVSRFKSEGYFVRGVDLKYPDFTKTECDEFLLCDLRILDSSRVAFQINDGFDIVCQLAADMGGATYINGGDNDANVVSNSVIINANVAKLCVETKVKTLFFASSACVYRSINNHTTCIENEVYPSFPDNEYGWEKLFSERMYQSFSRNFGLNIRIARFHSIVGPNATWNGGKEKAHSALARKVALCDDNGIIDVIGDGSQKRTFLHVNDCIDAIILLINSNIEEPLNIGSNHLVTINEYLEMLSQISGKNFKINYIDGPTGVYFRECPIDKIKSLLGWSPKYDLLKTTKSTYDWISNQIKIK
jgi:GDP-D-mannose 3',5'-epimerase